MSDPSVIKRRDAKAAGLKRYFTGKPCDYGHVSERQVSNGTCLACVAERRKTDQVREQKKAWVDANVEKTRARGNEYYRQNREMVLARQKERRDNNIEEMRKYEAEYRAANRERKRATNAKYAEANREKVRAIGRAYYRANAEKMTAYTKARRAANPEEFRVVLRNRRARIKAAGGTHTAEDVRRIHDAQKGRCACCRNKVGEKYEVDHIVPIARGGSNWPRNLQILCPDCNRSKNAKDPMAFSREMGLLL